MSNSIIYVVNSTTQTVAVNNAINFGTIVRRYGNCINASGTIVDINSPGYYNIDTNFTVTPSASGTLTITLYKDGTPIPGATASRTVASDLIYSLNIPTIVRHKCCCESSITAVVTGVATEISNASILVTKE